MSDDETIFFGQAAGVPLIPAAPIGGVALTTTGGTCPMPSRMSMSAIGTADV